MCLRTINKHPKVTDHDIVAYKIARRDSHGFYKTPLQWFTFELDKTYVDEVPLQMKTSDGNNMVYDIHGGVFHLFKSLDKIKDYYMGKNEVLIEALIPAGSEIYEGYYAGTATECYGTKQVRYLKEVKLP